MEKRFRFAWKKWRWIKKDKIVKKYSIQSIKVKKKTYIFDIISFDFLNFLSINTYHLYVHEEPETKLILDHSLFKLIYEQF